MESQCYGTFKQKHVVIFQSTMFPSLAKAVRAKLESHLLEEIVTADIHDISEELQHQYDHEHLVVKLTNEETYHEQDLPNSSTEQKSTVNLLHETIMLKNRGSKLTNIQEQLWTKFQEMSDLTNSDNQQEMEEDKRKNTPEESEKSHDSADKVGKPMSNTSALTQSKSDLSESDHDIPSSFSNDEKEESRKRSSMSVGNKDVVPTDKENKTLDGEDNQAKKKKSN
jgi:hypothetical protein